MHSPIGVFDSGMGGLSVLREIRKVLPGEDLIYVADSGHVPYGNKTPAFINDRCDKIGKFLADRGAKAMVIACNTASATAILPLRTRWPQIPIVGMEPAVKPAMKLTRVRKVGVLATVGTLKSARFAALLDRFAKSVEVFVQAAPGLVECVERGELTSAPTKALVASFVQPLREKGVDVIVLGCTHYPFLKEAISECAGLGIALIDTGAAVANQLVRRLGESNLLNPSARHGQETFFTSGDVESGQRTLQILWTRPATLQKLTD